MDMSNEFERVIFFEHTCKTAKAAYAKNPLNADNLTRWGAVLLELASFMEPAEGKKMTQDAISKLVEALEINPKKSERLWLLGNALTSFELMTPDAEEARAYFSKASAYFTKACEEAPELHAKFLMQQEATAATRPSPDKTASKKKGNSDLKYDIMGWVALAVGIVAITVFSQNNTLPPPPR